MEQVIYNTTNVISTTKIPEQINNTTSITVSSTSLSTFKTVWANFQVGSLSFSMLWSTFNSVNGYFYLLDYLYRIVQTFKLVASFWSKSIVALPIIDIRRKHELTSMDMKWFSRFSFCLRLLPLLWVQLTIVIVLIVIMVWLFGGSFHLSSDCLSFAKLVTLRLIDCVVVVMIPEYISYQSVCVYHSKGATFVSSNLAALAVNYASMDGNAAVTTGISIFNAQVGETCAAEATSSAATYTSIVERLITQNSTLKVLIFFYVLNNC
jgi:hypothetical protein